MLLCEFFSYLYHCIFRYILQDYFMCTVYKESKGSFFFFLKKSKKWWQIYINQVIHSNEGRQTIQRSSCNITLLTPYYVRGNSPIPYLRNKEIRCTLKSILDTFLTVHCIDVPSVSSISAMTLNLFRFLGVG